MCCALNAHSQWNKNTTNGAAEHNGTHALSLSQFRRDFNNVKRPKSNMSYIVKSLTPITCLNCIAKPETMQFRSSSHNARSLGFFANSNGHMLTKVLQKSRYTTHSSFYMLHCRNFQDSAKTGIKITFICCANVLHKTH